MLIAKYGFGLSTLILELIALNLQFDLESAIRNRKSEIVK